MAQVTLGKFFSGVPKFDGEGANHVTENELKFHVECSLKKNQTASNKFYLLLFIKF
jgi:hypothetical protein